MWLCVKDDQLSEMLHSRLAVKWCERGPKQMQAFSCCQAVVLTCSWVQVPSANMEIWRVWSIAACVGRVISSSTCQAQADGLMHHSEWRFTVGMYTDSYISRDHHHTGRLQNKLWLKSENTVADTNVSIVNMSLKTLVCYKPSLTPQAMEDW